MTSGYCVTPFEDAKNDYDLHQTFGSSGKSIVLSGSKQELLSVAKTITKYFTKKSKTSKKEKKK